MEEKEYLTLEEAAEYVSRNRATVYNYIRDLGLKTQKFKRDRRVYLAIADVKRIKEAIEKPWTAGPDEGKNAA